MKFYVDEEIIYDIDIHIINKNSQFVLTLSDPEDFVGDGFNSSASTGNSSLSFLARK